jgi:serine/threonine protein phosphatase PrpC
VTLRRDSPGRTAAGPLERYRAAIAACGDHCGGATDIGPVRARNEDAFWIAADASAFCVADGLGGLPAGDIASALAVAAVESFFQEAPALEASSLEDLVRDAAAAAQAAVLGAARQIVDLRGMATTLVVAAVRDGRAAVLHVGDSRALVVRGGAVAECTEDQNGAGELIRSGAITPEEARHHPSRSLVREVIGLPEGYQPGCSLWKLEPGDVLLLVTDGITEALSESELAKVLSERPVAASAAATLVSLAAIEGGSDNATAVVRYVT